MSRLVGTGLSVSIGAKQILDKTNIELNPGELLGLIGPNGAGKTTLLRTLAGLLEQSSGHTALDGKDLEQIPVDQRAREIAYLAQNGEAHWPIQVKRLVELGRTPHLSAWQHLGGNDKAVVRQVMEQTDTWGFKERIFSTLSGGERMRVLLARALAVEPRIILADEPVAALDLAHQIDVMELLRKHCEKGGSAMVVLHDLTLANHFCHRLQLLHNGQTLAVGQPSEVLTEENLREAYHIAPTHPGGSLSKAFNLLWHSTSNGADQ